MWHLKTKNKNKKLEGFRGFKLKSWNRTDYRNMMIKTRSQQRNNYTSTNKTRAKIKSRK